MEDDFKNNDTRNAFKFVRQSRAEYKHKTSLCRNKHGQITSGLAHIKKTWNQHFEELLGGEAETNINEGQKEGKVQEQEQEENPFINAVGTNGTTHFEGSKHDS